MVGLTPEAIPAHDPLAQKAAIVSHNIDIVSKAYQGATASVDPLTEASNHLSTDWQDLAIRPGPAWRGYLQIS